MRRTRERRLGNKRGPENTDASFCLMPSQRLARLAAALADLRAMDAADPGAAPASHHQRLLASAANRRAEAAEAALAAARQQLAAAEERAELAEGEAQAFQHVWQQASAAARAHQARAAAAEAQLAEAMAQRHAAAARGGTQL
jgi:hypothetical protein